MKKLDDLVFKNLHGLKDEDDQVKHKQDTKSLDNSSSDPQQQQQQMMYNYYNNNYGTNMMQQQQYGNQGGMNQAYMQNMQHQQGMYQNQNNFGMQQTNQFSQGNWNNPAQNQMQAGNRIPNIPHPSQNPNFAQMNPMMQKQYLQMYQMAQIQIQQMNQNPAAYQNQQNVQQYNNNPYKQGINQGFPSQGNPSAKQSSPEFNNFGSFNNNQNMQSGGDDDFADFQTSTSSHQNQKPNQLSAGNFGFGTTAQKSQLDDFDDFQDASATGKGAQNNFDEGFDDFQDASVTTTTQSAATNEPKNWDILDDFVEKKLPTQPQTTQNSTTQLQQQQQQIYAHAQNLQHNLTAQQAQYLQQQAMYQMNQNPGMFGQQQNLGAPPAQQNNNDDFEEFEEAKPSQATKPKSPTKEDLMFGALESKAIKKMGLENIVPQPATDYDFGDFGNFTNSNNNNPPQTQNTNQPQGQDFGGDDFEDFEEAAVTKPPVTEYHPPKDEKKLTFDDIYLSEFGLTDTVNQPHTTEPFPDTQAQPVVQNQPQTEDFGDFVEINEEKDNKPSQPLEDPFGAPQNFGGYNSQPIENKADNWGFDSAPAHHHDFGDFEDPQIAPPQTNQFVPPIHGEADGFDDFQEVAAPQKEIGKSWEHIDFPSEPHQVSKPQIEEVHDADFGDFEENVSPPAQPQTQVPEEGFGDFDFPAPVASTTAQNQEMDFGGFTSEPFETNIAQEKPQDNNNGFDDFEEFSNAPQTAKPEQKNNDWDIEEEPIEQKQPQKIDNDFDNDGFGDFEAEGEKNQDEPQSQQPEEKIQVEESNPKKEPEKKLSVYDMDWAEFGIEDKNQEAPPPMQFHFGGFEDKSGQDEKKTPTAFNDLYSLYGATTAVTPDPKPLEHEDDLFGEAQGAVIQEEKHEDQEEEFDDFEKPKPAEDDEFDFDATPQQQDEPKPVEDDGFDFGTTHQEEKPKEAAFHKHHDDDFADFEASATPENIPQQQAFEDPFFFRPQEPQQQKEENLFGDFGHPAPVKVEDSHDDDGFGDFDDHDAHQNQDFSDFKEPKQANQVEEQHEDDGFDDFEDAGQNQRKPQEPETPVKSLSHIGGTGLYHDPSDYGSLNEVPTHPVQAPQDRSHQDFDFKKASPIREERAHEDFGSFNDADQTDNQDKADHKDDSILHRADSSDYTPKNTRAKDESQENDDFGDFVGSKQDLPNEPLETVTENVPPSPPKENFNYTLDSVLAEYGIRADHVDSTDTQNLLAEEIEKRIEEITQQFEENLVKSTLMRAAMKKEKFKLNNEMVEELANELKSLQKYKEALLTQGQTKVIAELKEMNQTKARLIDEEELEEAIKYRDLIKNKEKEQIPKQKFEEFLNYSDNAQPKDYRLVLLDELRASNVPNKYINYFYIRFLGRTFVPQKEVEVPLQNEPEDIPQAEKEEVVETHEPQEEKNLKAETEAEEKQLFETEKEEEEEIQLETENKPEAENQLEEEEQPENQEEKEPINEREAEEKPQADETSDNENENEKKEEEEQFDNFGEAETVEKPQDETEDKKEEIEEDQQEPETAQDEPEATQTKQEGEDFGDFDQPETETEVQVEAEAEKKSEEDGAKGEGEGEKEEAEELTQHQDEEVQENKQDDNFGDFDQTNPKAEVEVGVEKKAEGEDDLKFDEAEYEAENENEKKEETPEQKDNQDDGFGDFDQPEPEAEVAKKTEEGFKFDEAEPEGETKNDEFGDFGEPETAKKTEEGKDDFKFDEGVGEGEGEKDEFEEENKPEDVPEQKDNQDDGFGDFDQPEPEVAKKSEGEDDFKFEEAEAEAEAEGENKNDDFGDFGEPETSQKPEEVQEQKDNEDDGFGDFDQPEPETEVAKKPEGEDDFKFGEAEAEGENKNDDFGDFGEPETAQKPEEEKDDFKFDEAEAEGEHKNDGFGDFGEPEVVKKPEGGDDFKFDEAEGENKNDDFGDFGEPETAQKPEEGQENKQDDDFGDFGEPEEKEDDFKFDGEKDDDEFDDFNKPKEAAPEQKDDDFGDFRQTEEAKQANEFADFDDNAEQQEEELRLEDIKTEEVPLTLEGLEEQKRRITQWSLMVKVMFSEDINFNNNVRKMLRQIIYELYKFNKIASAILQEKNKDAARAILSSQKFENYVAGIQILQSFYGEIQKAFQFIELQNKSFKKHYKAIEDLTQKVAEVRSQIKGEFNKEYPAQVLHQEEGKSADWLGDIEKLNKEALGHICHLSLKLNNNQFTEYSGNYYFLPYLNFLLNIE